MSIEATRALEGLQKNSQSSPKKVGQSPVSKEDFAQLLKSSSQKMGSGQLEQQSTPSGLQFSNHAIDRMRVRGIHFPKDVLQKIEDATQRAAQKGARETLVLTGDHALIVSVKNNKVVTVMDQQGLKENVFTNIDSTVVI